MDPKLQEQLDEQEIKINQIYESVRKTERYLRWIFWVTIGMVVLPVVLALLIIPPLVSEMSESLSVLTGL
jgi:type IV secretory pathway component VirB8